jgi:hypothetical protein
MDKDQVLTMDAYLLLSMLNMKLRDEFSNLHEFCLEYDIEDSFIKDKLANIGYIYNIITNQFKSM